MDLVSLSDKQTHLGTPRAAKDFSQLTSCFCPEGTDHYEAAAYEAFPCTLSYQKNPTVHTGLNICPLAPLPIYYSQARYETRYCSIHSFLFVTPVT